MVCLPFHFGISIRDKRVAFEAEFPSHIVRQFKYVSQTVPVIRVDDLSLSPTVIKVDAEGYDLKIIHGMEQTIRRCRPILMVENNMFSVNLIIAYLAEIGYAAWEYDHRHNQLIPYSGGRTRNVFFTAQRTS